MVIRTGGRLADDMNFYLGRIEVEMVKTFSFLGIIFTAGDSFSSTQTTYLSRSRVKVTFPDGKYLRKFINISIKHVCSLFDKLVTSVLWE